MNVTKPKRGGDIAKARAAKRAKNGPPKTHKERTKARAEKKKLIRQGKYPIVPAKLAYSLPSNLTIHAYNSNGMPICAKQLSKRNRERTGYSICQHYAGRKTDHPGTGRCYLHGGCGGAPVITGRYTFKHSPRLQRIYNELSADPDPLNLIPELTAGRTLFQDWMNRFDKYAKALIAWNESFENGHEDRERKPKKVLDIADGRSSLEVISRIVARIEHIRAENAISKKQLILLVEAMGKVVEANVEDADQLKRIKRGWLNIRTPA